MVDNTTIIDSLTGLVVFALNGKEYCADMKDISAIINPRELKQASELEGEKPFIKLNKLKIPILNLHNIFKLKMTGNLDDKRILTVEPENFIFGFLVDRVKEIFTMNKEFKNHIEFMPMDKETLLVGIFNYEGRNLHFPDFNLLYKKIHA